MALYITRFLEGQGHSWEDFGDDSIALGERSSVLHEVRIYVSCTICNSCFRLVAVISETTSKHKFKFRIFDQDA